MIRRSGAALIEWQPIESAPKDGTRVLLWVPRDLDGKCLRLGFWWSSETLEYGQVTHRNQYWFTGLCASFNPSSPAPEPTHWAPLPDGPSISPAF